MKFFFTVNGVGFRLLLCNVIHLSSANATAVRLTLHGTQKINGQKLIFAHWIEKYVWKLAAIKDKHGYKNSKDCMEQYEEEKKEKTNLAATHSAHHLITSCVCFNIQNNGFRGNSATNAQQTRIAHIYI